MSQDDESTVPPGPNPDEATPQATAKGEGVSVLSTLSHEVRTPLNNIIGFADMMSAEMLGPMSHPQYREYAEDIRKSGQSILDLLDELLENRRLENIADSDEHHANLIDLAPDMIAICSEDGQIETLNLRVARFWRWPRSRRKVCIWRTWCTKISRHC